jgi:hypothetical protein
MADHHPDGIEYIHYFAGALEEDGRISDEVEKPGCPCRPVP